MEVGLLSKDCFVLLGVDISETCKSLMVPGLELEGAAVCLFGLDDIAFFAQGVAEVVEEGGAVGVGFEGVAVEGDGVSPVEDSDVEAIDAAG